MKRRILQNQDVNAMSKALQGELQSLSLMEIQEKFHIPRLLEDRVYGVAGLLPTTDFSRIWNGTSKYVAGAVTGSRLRGDPDPDRSRRNHREILAYLKSMDYAVLTVNEAYFDYNDPKAKCVEEKSLFAINYKKEGWDEGELFHDLIRLGKKYDQDFVLLIPAGDENEFVYGTSSHDTAWPGLDVKRTAGDETAGKVKSQYLAMIRGCGWTSLENADAPPAAAQCAQGKPSVSVETFPDSISGLRGFDEVASSVAQALQKIK